MKFIDIREGMTVYSGDVGRDYGAKGQIDSKNITTVTICWSSYRASIWTSLEAERFLLEKEPPKRVRASDLKPGLILRSVDVLWHYGDKAKVTVKTPGTCSFEWISGLQTSATVTWAPYNVERYFTIHNSDEDPTTIPAMKTATSILSDDNQEVYKFFAKAPEGTCKSCAAPIPCKYHP